MQDVEASLAFYELLGIRESFRLNKDDGTVMLVYLHVGGDRFIELFPNGPGPDASRPGSFKHICLLTEDLEGAVEELRSKGVKIDREPKQGLDTNLQAWISDPDGNALELMQLSPNSPQKQVASGTETVTLGSRS